jgi:hypothetical protein
MDVNFTTKWDPNFQILDTQGSKPIQAVGQSTGGIYKFSSLRQAASV